ncbi:MAG: SPOR domain-containing protein [Cyclobacteriaceae bacterium]|nr:SPOR domain-containing protein [Cyclobacteriaceae bacterium]
MEGKEFYDEDENNNNESSRRKQEEDPDAFGLPDIDASEGEEDYSYKRPEEEVPSVPEESDEGSSYESEEVAGDYYEPPSEEEQQTWGAYSTEEGNDDEGPVEEDEEGTENEKYVHGMEDKDEDGKAPIGIIIGVIIAVLVVAAILFFWLRGSGEKEVAVVKQEQIVADAPDAGFQEEQRQAQQQEVKPAEPVKPSPSKGMYPAGEITRIPASTGKYYIIIGSFIDVDLATDYGKKLAKDNVGSAILAPRGNAKFHRLAIADFASENEASAKAEELKAKYGPDVWVVKY